jgi:hypothetical protein
VPVEGVSRPFATENAITLPTTARATNPKIAKNTIKSPLLSKMRLLIMSF